jgi:uncharacterized membrane protein
MVKLTTFNKAKGVASNVSKWLIFFITAVGIYIILSGVVVALAYVFDIKWLQGTSVFGEMDADIPGFDRFTRAKKAKLAIAQAVSISLAFLLAASLIWQTLVPDYYHLGLLGGLVIIHVIIGYTVNKEINDAIRQQVQWVKDRPILQAIPLKHN